MFGLAVLLSCGHASAEQYAAFSLSAARSRIEHAGTGWRTSEPQVLDLAGINQVEGFVYDAKSEDLILVGRIEEGRAPLTLDDLVVAIRARLRYNEWPLVSIDPLRDSERTGQQRVRFEGHVENTAFGLAMFAADYRLKQIAMGLQAPGVRSVQTLWRRSLAHLDDGENAHTKIDDRFWFYPVNPEVIERDGVCVIRGLKVAVFTELLEKTVDGKVQTDLKNAKDPDADAFASDVSAHYDEMCVKQPEFNRLRGLEELVGLSKALEGIDPKPNLEWWLGKYPLATVATPQQAKLLRRQNDGDGRRFAVSGGVHLTAIATKVRKGEVGALRDIVLAVRPSPSALSWSFLVGQWGIALEAGMAESTDVEPMISQARFLGQQERYSEELELLDRVLMIVPGLAEAWELKASALANLQRSDEAIICADRALALGPDRAYAWVIKGIALVDQGKSKEALECCDHAIDLHPDYAYAWRAKGPALMTLGRFSEEVKCCERALKLDPDSSYAWYFKGLALYSLARYADAKVAWTKAADLGDMNAEQNLSAMALQGH